MNKIADLWRYAVIATQEPKELDPALFGKTLTFIPMNNKDDYGFFAEFEDRIIICFRGTKGRLEPWIQNFDPYPLKTDEKKLFLSNTFKEGKWGKGIIHDGFYTAWSFFKNEISDILKGLIKPIYCTGHSRGGALATLCSRHIAKNLSIPCSCISYGAPAQGTSDYRDEYNKLPIYCTRVVNGFDIVPNLPPYDLGFRQVGILLNLPQPKWHKVFHRIRDHFYSNYTKAIKKYCNKDLEAAALMDKILPFCDC